MRRELLRAKLRDKGLKATPRRMLILEAITELNNHPAADEIVRYIRNRNLNIATQPFTRHLTYWLQRM